MKETIEASVVNGRDVTRLSRILVPTDFTDYADRAVKYALGLARLTHAHVEIMHVTTVYRPELFGGMEDDEFMEDVRECLEEKTLARLRAVCERSNSPEGTTTIAVTDPSPVLAILEHAEASCADLIVVGTHGRRGLGRLLIGSVAEEVVHRARNRSVLVVREDSDVTSVNRVLAPTDLSVNAERAVEAARSLAVRFGAELHILHVVEPIPMPVAVAAGTRGLYDYIPKVRGAVVDELKRRYGDSRGDVDDGEWPTVFQHVEQGHAARSIVDFIESHEMDLVVMSSQGGSMAPPFFVGSVMERVVRAATSPVFVVA